MFAVPRISRATSRPGSVPSSASSTCAVERSAAGMSSSASLKDSAPVCPRASGEDSSSSSAVGSEFRARVEALEHALQVLARVALQRGQDLVELHRRGRLRDLDRVARVELGCARRAGLEVHEEVALEEDARADLGRRVLVQRQRGVVELHHQHGAVGALHTLDGLDLADLDARDPDRRVGPDRVRRLELRPDLEAARERDVLGEAEEHHEGGQDHGHEPDEGVRPAGGAASAACHHSPSST